MPVPDPVLEILRCLECAGTLEERESALVCRSCGLHYPVDGDIPVMLIDAAFRPA